MKFVDIGDPAFIEIKNNKAIEYKKNKQYYIKSDLVWVSDCEYNSTITEIKYPDCPFAIGTVMNVKIRKIEGDYVYYTSTVSDATFEGKLEILSAASRSSK